MPDAFRSLRGSTDRSIEQLLIARSDLLDEVHRKLSPVLTMIRRVCGTPDVVLEDYYGENGLVVLFVLRHDRPRQGPEEVVFSIPAILVDTQDEATLLQYVTEHYYEHASSAA